MLELKSIEHGRVYLTENTDYVTGNNDIAPASIDECRVCGFLHGIVNGELMEYSISRCIRF
jgi:hypothetical protein